MGSQMCMTATGNNICQTSALDVTGAMNACSERNIWQSGQLCKSAQNITSEHHSLASMIPSGPMLKFASRSGREGEPTTLHTRFSPLPFLSQSRVVVACAMMLPPIGLIEGPANMLPPSKLAATTCGAPHVHVDLACGHPSSADRTTMPTSGQHCSSKKGTNAYTA